MLRHRCGGFVVASALARFAVIVPAAAILACSEDPTSTGLAAGDLVATQGAYGTYVGVLEARDLIRIDGRRVSLRGWQTELFTDLVGAELAIDRSMDPDPENGLTIGEFQVRSFAGMPVLDGILEEKDGVHFVRTREGVSHLIGAAPDALARCVGRRVWVALDGARAARHGLLERID